MHWHHSALKQRETGAVCFPVLIMIGCNGTFLSCNRVETKAYIEKILLYFMILYTSITIVGTIIV